MAISLKRNLVLNLLSSLPKASYSLGCSLCSIMTVLVILGRTMALKPPLGYDRLRSCASSSGVKLREHLMDRSR